MIKVNLIKKQLTDWAGLLGRINIALYLIAAAVIVWLVLS